MSSYNDALKLKLAWQTAFEQRICPPAEILYAESPDENLKKHLSFCDSCRESRAIAKDGKAGFQGLFAELPSNTVAHKSDALKQAGQIWTIDTSLGKWVEDGRYFSSPTVLLLSRSEAGSAWKVAQLYTDKRLMGDGDVWLGDQFGFAQSWNCYTLPCNALECWLGTVSESLVSEVATSAATNMQPPAVDSIISFFREMETAVGLNAVHALESEPAEVVDKSIIDLLPGLKLAIGGTKEFMLDITMETLELLRATFRPALVLRGGPAKPSSATLPDELKKLIQENCQVIPIELKIAGETLTISIKWLHGKPLKAPLLNVLFKGVNIEDIGFVRESSEKIVIKSPLLSGVTLSQISSLKLSYLESVMKLHITFI